MKEISKRAKDLIVGAFSVLFGIFMFVASGQYHRTAASDPLGPAAFPRALAVLSLFLGLIILVKGLISKERTARAAEGPADDEKHLIESPTVRLWVSIALFAVYIAVMPFLGFFISTLLFVVCFMFLLDAGNWVKIGLSGLLVSGVIYVIFYYVLQVFLPKGPLF
jgi:drug/metabolite transporter (DMT)-like permease